MKPSSSTLTGRPYTSYPPSCMQCRRRCLPFNPTVRLTPPRTASAATDIVTQGVPAQEEQQARQLSSPPSSSSSPPAPAPAPAPQPSAATFPWTSHWYPVAVVADLDPGRPHAAHLLGIPLALWRDAGGQWHAVEDRCPHRLAPLSEGRVEADGTLQCAYHGWQFDGRGACTHIPQLRGDERAQGVACASRRSCVRAFPCQLLHGLVWVLPDASEQGWKKAAESPVPVNAVHDLLLPQSNEGSPDGLTLFGDWFARDLPIRYDTLLENLVDPAHVPFAHHGVMGNRSMEKGTTTVPRGVGVEGFVCDGNFGALTGTVFFQAPCMVLYNFKFGTLLYAVPTKPGWSRFISASVVKNSVLKSLPWMAVVALRFFSAFKWYNHITRRHPILDGDTYMLHVQERQLHEQGASDWRSSYYMPAPADGSVVAVRRWLDEFGGRVPTCEPGTAMPPQMSKREALDRYSQHTAHCRHCQKGLRQVDLGAVLCGVCCVLSAAVLAARCVAGLPLLAPASGAALLAAVACGGALAALRALRQQFYYVDYVHADKN